MTPEDLVACTAPFAFTFGLGMLIVFTLRAGACAFLTETATPAQLADLLRDAGWPAGEATQWARSRVGVEDLPPSVREQFHIGR